MFDPPHVHTGTKAHTGTRGLRTVFVFALLSERVGTTSTSTVGPTVTRSDQRFERLPAKRWVRGCMGKPIPAEHKILFLLRPARTGRPDHNNGKKAQCQGVRTQAFCIVRTSHAPKAWRVVSYVLPAVDGSTSSSVICSQRLS